MKEKTLLKSIFHESCIRHGVPGSEKDNLINSGMALFEINSNGDVFPLNADYPTIAQYVIAHRGDNAQPVESTEVTKEHLYNRLANSAKAGDMAEYRRLRKQYSAMA